MNDEHPGSVPPLGRSRSHESAREHVNGRARYVDDIPMPGGRAGGLWAMVIASPHAHARIVRRDATAARAIEGVAAVLFVDDVPGDNMIGAIVHDEPLLATDAVHCCGQAVGVVVAESLAECRRAIEAVVVEYESLPAILTIAEAIDAGAFSTPAHAIRRGDVDAALAGAHLRLTGEVASGGQDHFYLETHVALAIPEEAGTMRVLSSTQHPTEVQKLTASVLGIGAHAVVCEVPRMGGGFGGKESQASNIACLAALGAWKTGRPVKLWLERDADMRQTGNRHPCWSRYDAAFSEDGLLLGLRVEIYSDGGWSADLSGPVMDRALFHLDSSYFVPAADFVGRVCRTHLPSNTAFRGFGGPQGMFVIEAVMSRAADALGIEPAALRVRNFYGDSPRDRAPYGQVIDGNRLPRIWKELSESAQYSARRDSIDRANSEAEGAARHYTSGIGFQPVKFGISFTKSLLNQAGALVLVYADGTVQLNHGGTEMGQGLYTKMIAICAHELGVGVSSIRQMVTATDKVPNTSPTAASSGSDLNGQAIAVACASLRERMAPVAASLLGLDPGTVMHFANGVVRPRREDGDAAAHEGIAFATVANDCWLQRVSLSATGFYATPGIDYDEARGQGTPFFYYAFGGAVSEVEVCALTGEWRLRRVDILHDVGNSLVPSIDIGQIEGGFVQGLGWLGCEEVIYDGEGRLLTHGPSTYKIPAVGDVPEDFRVQLLARAPSARVIHGSKAVGEPPFMLAISVWTALRHAVEAAGGSGEALRIPCTPEAVLRAIETRPGTPD